MGTWKARASFQIVHICAGAPASSRWKCRRSKPNSNMSSWVMDRSSRSSRMRWPKALQNLPNSLSMRLGTVEAYGS